MISLVLVAALSVLPTCDLEKPTGQPGCTREAVDALPMNAIQVIGTHNSYKSAIAPAEMATFKLINPKVAASLDYAHPALQEQLDAGLITPQQAALSGNKNLVTRALGVDDTVQLEAHAHDLQPGDLILLCSDGLCDMLDDEHIAELLRAGTALESTTAALIDAANQAGGKDNIAVILARVSGHVGASRAWWPFKR